VKDGFQDLGAFSSTANRPNGPTRLRDDPHGTMSSPIAAQLPQSVQRSAGIDVAALQSQLNSALGQEIKQKEVVLRMTQEGFVISLHELGFFDSGEAKLLPGAAEKIKHISSVLMQYGLNMRVEGHSDNIPIHNAQFNSNWDLSTARASAVAMMLLSDANFDPQRLSIAGYGEYHPVASNATATGRAANRRVDIVILSTTAPAPSQPAPSPHS
jgi:chemotaxis protein MotB